MRTLGDIIAFWKGGIVLYGSILGGAAGFLFYRFMRPFPFLPMVDVVAPALAVGVAFGRLGCFFNGCCFGGKCAYPWAVRFPFKSIPWGDQFDRGWISATATKSLPIHPTQLYSSFDGFLLLALLLAFYPFRRKDGEVMALLMVTYPITRFLIEILRDDEGSFFAGMTISQTISVGIFAGGLAFWAYLRSRPAGRFIDTLAPAEAATSAVA